MKYLPHEITERVERWIRTLDEEVEKGGVTKKNRDKGVRDILAWADARRKENGEPIL